MVAGINIGGSIEIGGGISFGPAVSLGSSFTITSSDISNPQLWFSGYSSYSSTGFTSDGGTQLYNGLRYDITFDLLTRILDAQTAAGFDPGSAWVWQAAFATGGTVLVRLGLVNGLPATITIAPIDQTDTRWQTGDVNSATLPGTFTFPATFTPYSPATAEYGNDSWC